MGAASSWGLRDLILVMKGDRTYAGLEKASGGVVKAQRWNQIANGIRVTLFPEPRTIKAMARALNVGEEVVLLAFAREIGLDVGRHRNRFADLLPPGVSKLSEKKQAAILSVIHAMTEEADQPGEERGQ